MKTPAAIPLFGDAYLADTTHLTTEEHGAYLLLMIAAWRQPNCDLPNDDKKLARIAGLSARKWSAIRATILEFWTIDDGRIFQPRLRKEYDFACKKSEANRKSAKARWDKQVTENIEGDGCERISERNAPPPPPNNRDLSNDKSLSECEIEQSNFDTQPPAKPSTSEIDDAVEIWNKASAHYGWPTIRKMNPDRRKKLAARLSEIGGVAEWRAALVRATKGMLGAQPPPTWFSFDWLTTNQTNILKVIEGNYDRKFGESGNGSGTGNYGSNRGASPIDMAARAMQLQAQADTENGFGGIERGDGAQARIGHSG